MSRNKLIQVGDSFTSAIFSDHCGIYAIVNRVNGKAYIGQSVDMLDRWRSHYLDLTRGGHSNRALLKDWQAYGEKQFEFRVLDLCQVKDLNAKELDWILSWQPQPYNLDPRPEVLDRKTRPRLQYKKHPTLRHLPQPERVSDEFVAEMLAYYQGPDTPPYIAEIFERRLTEGSAQNKQQKLGRKP